MRKGFYGVGNTRLIYDLGEAQPWHCLPSGADSSAAPGAFRFSTSADNSRRLCDCKGALAILGGQPAIRQQPAVRLGRGRIGPD